ncbi:hypothetical protein Ancab_018954 [Ancistrocladus abbreviatus]
MSYSQLRKALWPLKHLVSWSMLYMGGEGVNDRLDMALCTNRWLDFFRMMTVFHLPLVMSDHRPILVHDDDGFMASGGEKPFSHPEAFDRGIYSPPACLSCALNACPI